MNQLRSLLILLGTVMVGGGTLYVAVTRPSTTAADLNAAGVNTNCPPRVVECKVRNRCGATPAYQVVQTKVNVCTGGANLDDKLVIFRWPRVAGVRCWEPVGTPAEACKTVGVGCSDGTLCVEADELPVTVQAPLCACSSGANCTWTPPGGIAQAAPRGNTLEPGTFSGAGCVPKYCGPELAGEQGQSLPAGCPP